MNERPLRTASRFVPEASRSFGPGSWTIAVSLSCSLAGCTERSAGPPAVAGGRTDPNRSASSSATQIRFHDRTPGGGVDFTYRTGAESGRALIPETLGGGCGVADVDRDGNLDLVFPGGGHFDVSGEPVGGELALFLQTGPWKYVDVTQASGLGVSRHYTHGIAIGDFDADGFPDLLFTGYGGLQFYRNAGDGTFADQTEEAGLADKLWSTSAAWGDLNQDGHLDLFVCHYVDWSVHNNPDCPGTKAGVAEVCPPRSFQGLPDALFLSTGDCAFRDVSQECGLRSDGKGLGVLLADFDGDRDLDIFVANDTVPNHLYRNLGSATSSTVRFEEIGVESGTALNEMGTPNGSMGAAVLDFDADGRPDIWVSAFEFESPALYRNEGDLTFLHVSNKVGIASGSSSFVGFGTVAGDFDADGDEDVLVANGHILRNPAQGSARQPCHVFENLGDKTFRNVVRDAGTCLGEPRLGRGLAKADLDGDGDWDVVLSPSDGPVRLFENISRAGRGIRLRLVGRRSPRDGQGASVSVKSAGVERRYVVYAGESYLSSAVTGLFCGIPGDAGPATLRIDWPAGSSQVISGVVAGSDLTVVEPD